MSNRKDSLLQRLTEDTTPEMQNGDVGENGKFPIGSQPIGFPQIDGLRDQLEQFFTLRDSVLAGMREVLAVTNASPGLRQFSGPISAAISEIQAASGNLKPFDLQTALNGLHRALGGSGTPYIR